MEPIISPWLIYFISVCDIIHEVAIAMTFLAVFSLGGYALFARPDSCCFRREDDDARAEAELYTRVLKRVLIVFVVSLLILIFVPSKNTLIQMAVANYITPDNISIVSESVYEATDKYLDLIVNKLKAVK